MRALVSLLGNCESNTGLSDWVKSTETAATVSLSVYLLINPYFFPVLIDLSLLDVTNMDDAQRVTSYFRCKNIDEKTQSFSILNMDLGWRLNNLSC